jgi:hypothetical protein
MQFQRKFTLYSWVLLRMEWPLFMAFSPPISSSLHYNLRVLMDEGPESHKSGFRDYGLLNSAILKMSGPKSLHSGGRNFTIYTHTLHVDNTQKIFHFILDKLNASESKKFNFKNLLFFLILFKGVWARMI